MALVHHMAFRSGQFAAAHRATGLRTILLFLVSGDLGRLHSADLGEPGAAGLGFADSTQLVRGETGNTDIVDAL